MAGNPCEELSPTGGQPNFIPSTKVASAHPSINYFQIFWCHMIDETFSHLYI